MDHTHNKKTWLADGKEEESGEGADQLHETVTKASQYFWSLEFKVLETHKENLHNEATVQNIWASGFLVDVEGPGASYVVVNAIAVLLIMDIGEDASGSPVETWPVQNH